MHFVNNQLNDEIKKLEAKVKMLEREAQQSGAASPGRRTSSLSNSNEGDDDMGDHSNDDDDDDDDDDEDDWVEEEAARTSLTRTKKKKKRRAPARSKAKATVAVEGSEGDDDMDDQSNDDDDDYDEDWVEQEPERRRTSSTRKKKKGKGRAPAASKVKATAAVVKAWLGEQDRDKRLVAKMLKDHPWRTKYYKNLALAVGSVVCANSDTHTAAMLELNRAIIAEEIDCAHPDSDVTYDEDDGWLEAAEEEQRKDPNGADGPEPSIGDSRRAGAESGGAGAEGGDVDGGGGDDDDAAAEAEAERERHRWHDDNKEAAFKHFQAAFLARSSSNKFTVNINHTIRYLGYDIDNISATVDGRGLVLLVGSGTAVAPLSPNLGIGIPPHNYGVTDSRVQRKCQCHRRQCRPTLRRPRGSRRYGPRGHGCLLPFHAPRHCRTPMFDAAYKRDRQQWRALAPYLHVRRDIGCFCIGGSVSNSSISSKRRRRHGCPHRRQRIADRRL